MSATVQAALTDATRRLANAGVDGAARDARVLMAHALGIEAGRVTLHAPDVLEARVAERFEAAIDARLDRVPVSHIIGRRSFYGREFRVNQAVLDPRPETEVLIAEALKAPFARVLDLGTGSGCILITLLAERGGVGMGTDLSEAALDLARANARDLGVDAEFLPSDWFDAVEGRFDLIVSNPPYIAADEMRGLAPELAHEPRMALTDEADGLSAYRVICDKARDHLDLNGRLIVEIGPTQGDAVAQMMRDMGLDDVQIHADLDGRARVVSGKNRA